MRDVDNLVNKIRNKIKLFLKIDKIGNDENLIELGLTSIDVMNIISDLHKNNVRVTFAELMEDPYFCKWEKIINNAPKVNHGGLRRESNENNNLFKLTDTQYAYLVGGHKDKKRGGVTCHAYIEIDGCGIDSDKLNIAWNKLQYRHPMFRARFTSDGRQEILNRPYSETIEIFDFSKLQENDSKTKLEKIRDNISHRKLNVDEGEVAGLKIAKLAKNKNRIFFDIDLLVCDVMSIGIILNDLGELYSGIKLENLDSYTFKDYIKNLEVDSDIYEEDKKFWKDKLNSNEVEVPNLPTKKSSIQLEKIRFNRRKRVIDKNEWNKIKEISRKYKITPSIILLTSYALILERWCNQDKFFINMPIFNRKNLYKNLDNMVGDFTNILLIEHKCMGEESFLETLNRVNRTFIKNVSHSSYSGVKVQRDISKMQGSIVNVAPLVFTSNIDYTLESEVFRENLGEISYMISQTPGVWLDFQSYIKDEDLILCWDSIDELFPEEMLEDMFNSLHRLLLSLTVEENWTNKIDVLPEKQKEKRNKESNSLFPLRFPEERLYDGFIKNVECNPNKVAIIDTETKRKITYLELYTKSLKIASYLKEKGVKKGEYVGVTLPRTSMQIFAILGILFTGAVYVPIGISQPSARRSKIYDQIGITHVISDIDTLKKCNLNSKETSVIDIDEAMNSCMMNLVKPVEISPFDSSYIIMTSGTTGIPKGVEIMHTSAINTCIDINEKYRVNSNDKLLMVSSIEFDLSIYDIFGILRAGGTIVTTNEFNYKDPSRWLDLIEHYEISIWNSVPILFDMLITIAEGLNKKLPLRIVMLSGDWIEINLPNRFYKISKNNYSQVVAMGGATEASIWSNYINVPRKIPKNWKSIPYGKALNNQIYRVVDKFGRICPDYVIGELLIGGVGVAKGYHGDKKLSDEKFFDCNGLRWYRTGDNGRTWNDGTIEFLGRKDTQVKIKGNRIELGEIESALKKHDGVVDCLATIIEHHHLRRIGVYLVIDKCNFDLSRLKSSLKNFLQEFMLPDFYYICDNREITENGKLEREKIKKLIEIKFINEEKSYSNIGNVVLTNTEKYLIDLWGSKLNIENINVMDNYFKLGGDSLIATSLISEINAKFGFGKNFSINMIFKYPTIKQLSDKIDSLLEDIDIYEI